MAKYICEKSTPLETLVDSLHSILNTAAFLTMYKVKGYGNDPQRLLDDLVDQGVFSKLSLIIPPRVTGELGRFGGVFTKPTIEIQANGKLGIRRDIVEHYINERKSTMRNYSTNAGADKDLDRPGCPVGRRIISNPNSGVDMAAKIFANTVRAQKI